MASRLFLRLPSEKVALLGQPADAKGAAKDRQFLSMFGRKRLSRRKYLSTPLMDLTDTLSGQAEIRTLVRQR
jgi:hypothetical protein